MRGDRSADRPRTVVVTSRLLSSEHRAASRRRAHGGGSDAASGNRLSRQRRAVGCARDPPRPARPGPARPGADRVVAGRAPPSAGSEHGPDSRVRSGSDDPYFPQDGNGGIDVLHYDVRDSYSFGSGRLAGRTRLDVRATQDLSRFDLDFLLPVRLGDRRRPGARVRAVRRPRAADHARRAAGQRRPVPRLRRGTPARRPTRARTVRATGSPTTPRSSR